MFAQILLRDKTVYTFLFKMLFQHLHILRVSETVPTWLFKKLKKIKDSDCELKRNLAVTNSS